MDKELEDLFLDIDPEEEESTLLEYIQILRNSLVELNDRLDSLDVTGEIETVNSLIKQTEKNIQAVLEERVKKLSGSFQRKIQDIDDTIKSLRNSDSKAEADLLFTRRELEVKQKESLEAIETFQSKISDIFLDFVKETKREQKNIRNWVEKIKKELEDDIRLKFSAQQSRGSGNMNRQIRVEGVDVLTRYTDINLVGTTSSITTTTDNTNKRVNIIFPSGGGGGGSPSIGGAIIGGQDTAVLFVHPASILTQDPTKIAYDPVNKQFILGGISSISGADSKFPVTITNNINNFSAVEFQNLSAGNTASTDLSISADNDSSTIIGHYIDVGIWGSGFVAATSGQVRTISLNAGGSGYTVNDTLTIVGGASNSTVTVLTVNGSGVILTIALADNGTGYSVANGLSTTGGTGSGGKINVLTLVDETMYGPNDGYVYVSGGNLILGTDGNVAGKIIKFHAGGFGATNEIGRLAPSGLTVGYQPGSVAGKVLLPGATSGTVTTTVASVAGTWTLTLPTGAGVNGQILQTDGNGITSWANAGGTGITRTVSVISVSSTIAAAAKTDYVMFANVGITATLPTAIGNANLYTIKNYAASSVLIATSAGETIDDSATALLTTQYQSLDLISNGSIWGVV